MIAALLAALVTLGLAQAGTPTVSLSDLDAVKALYAQAAYDEALQRLSAVPSAAVTEQLEEYRALSLLALGRTAEAQDSFERLIHRAPLFHLNENDVSPRIAAMFTDVRRRVLPGIAREMYATGKSSYDQKRYGDAIAQLNALLTVLADPDMAASTASVDDLKQLAEGFVRLSQLEQEMAARAAAPPPEPAPPPAPAAPPVEVVSKIVIYAAGDSGVTPPVEVERRMPAWNPPAIIARTAEYRGELQVVVDEIGNVESVAVTRPSLPSYDVTLADMARRWRYKPALFNGQPVKYRLVYDIVLGARP